MSHDSMTSSGILIGNLHIRFPDLKKMFEIEVKSVGDQKITSKEFFLSIKIFFILCSKYKDFLEFENS